MLRPKLSATTVVAQNASLPGSPPAGMVLVRTQNGDLAYVRSQQLVSPTTAVVAQPSQKPQQQTPATVNAQPTQPQTETSQPNENLDKDVMNESMLEPFLKSVDPAAMIVY